MRLPQPSEPHGHTPFSLGTTSLPVLEMTVLKHIEAPHPFERHMHRFFTAPDLGQRFPPHLVASHLRWQLYRLFLEMGHLEFFVNGKPLRGCLVIDLDFLPTEDLLPPGSTRSVIETPCASILFKTWGASRLMVLA